MIKNTLIIILVILVLILGLFLFNKKTIISPIQRVTTTIKLKDSTELIKIQNYELEKRDFEKIIKQQTSQIKEYQRIVREIKPETIIQNNTITKIDTFIKTDSITKFPISFKDSNRYYNINGEIVINGIKISIGITDTVTVIQGKKETTIRHSNKYIKNNNAIVYKKQEPRRLFGKILDTLAKVTLGFVMGKFL